ncbi:mCG1028300, isoform CRA_b, partial [Mus musculus]
VKASHTKTSMMACLQPHIRVSRKQCTLTAENLERYLWVLVYVGKNQIHLWSSNTNNNHC